MNPDGLITLLFGNVAGRVARNSNGRLTFNYDDAWRESEDVATTPRPLSLSMPLAAAEHGHRRIEAYLWGLLPDSAPILEQWARRFHVSPRSPFALIAHVGEDCAGAVQFVRAERLEEVRGSGPGKVEWLDDAGVAARLRALREDPSAWRVQKDTGQFSLAGAQPKTALLFHDGRWGVPQGRMPTTHILKPPSRDFDGHVENEHFCLTLARGLGLPAATSEVRRFEKELAIVVERYDRISTATMASAAAAESAALAARTMGTPDVARRAAEAAARAISLAALARSQPILRLHQEDVCQALGILPSARYQSEGGPGPASIVELLRTYSSRPTEDVSTFIDALALNWLIAGTDGHAKNFSLLHGGGGRVRLAPLYDLASALPYKNLDQERLKLAMKIGDKYRLRHIARHDWERLADQLAIPEEEVVMRVASMASRMPDAVQDARKQMANEGLEHPILARLAASLVQRAKQCSQALAP